MQYHVVAAISELDPSGQLHVDVNGEEILLCSDGDNYYAVSYYCSHEAFTLEGGSVHNNCITCPYHGAEFDLKSGEALAAPAFEPIKTYPLQVNEDEGTISIGIDG